MLKINIVQILKTHYCITNAIMCKRRRLLLLHQHSISNISVSSNNPIINEENILNPEHMHKTIKCFENTPALIMDKHKPKKYAAVLIPIIIDKNGELSILYTRRSGQLRQHVRQISFPGGMKDETDKSFEDCALRETEEEIGLPVNKIKIWGRGNLIRPPHTAAIMPIVGSIKNLQLNELKINKAEVDEVIIVKIKDLCSTEARKHTQFRAGYSAPVFVIERGKIWGITGAITSRFLSCLLPDLCNNNFNYLAPYKLINS